MRLTILLILATVATAEGYESQPMHQPSTGEMQRTVTPHQHQPSLSPTDQTYYTGHGHSSGRTKIENDDAMVGRTGWTYEPSIQVWKSVGPDGSVTFRDYKQHQDDRRHDR